ncbi:hypothetical protein BDB01DRAFT_793595 [Pilobolus umbonatus]|nr:hypothetical protein BDB01DRAFT_793595 [Pilobolus umbonatus]
MSHSFISEGIERVPETTESSRRYVQWKEEDVGLLLNDLEQPGHYTKWKENKSGYSKRVAEAVFKNVMYHEAIKFKVRWLESRYKRWYQQLTALEGEEDKSLLSITREKMNKEFPYYDRCRPIFERKMGLSSMIPVMQHATPSSSNNSTHNEDILSHPSSPTFKQESILSTSESILDKATRSLLVVENKNDNNTMNTVHHDATPYDTNNKKNRPPGILSTAPDTNFSLKRKRIAQNNTHPTYQPQPSYRITDNIQEDRRLKLMTLELESKKMEHEERMQEMKLEQLRLEIELQKLKRPTSSPHMNGSF